MTPEEKCATHEAKLCSDVVNNALRWLAISIAAAQDWDSVRCACGVAIMATVIADNNPAAREALARQFIELAHELAPTISTIKQ